MLLESVDRSMLLLLLLRAPGQNYRGSQGLVKRAFREGGPESTRVLFAPLTGGIPGS